MSNIKIEYTNNETGENIESIGEEMRNLDSGESLSIGIKIDWASMMDEEEEGIVNE
jgi:hypothetical protein